MHPLLTTDQMNSPRAAVPILFFIKNGSATCKENNTVSTVKAMQISIWCFTPPSNVPWRSIRWESPRQQRLQHTQRRRITDFVSQAHKPIANRIAMKTSTSLPLINPAMHHGSTTCLCFLLLVCLHSSTEMITTKLYKRWKPTQRAAFKLW